MTDEQAIIKLGLKTGADSLRGKSVQATIRFVIQPVIFFIPFMTLDRLAICACKHLFYCVDIFVARLENIVGLGVNDKSTAYNRNMLEKPRSQRTMPYIIQSVRMTVLHVPRRLEWSLNSA